MKVIMMSGIVLIAGCGTTFAQGRTYSIEEQEACTADAFRFCQSSIPDIPRITACLQARRDELSPPCQRMFTPGRERRLDAPASSTTQP